MSLSPQAFPKAPEVIIRKIQGRIKIANEKYAKRRLNHMYSHVFIMSIMWSWRNRWLFFLSIFCHETRELLKLQQKTNITNGNGDAPKIKIDYPS